MLMTRVWRSTIHGNGKWALGFWWWRRRICSSSEGKQRPTSGKRIAAALWGNGDYGRLGLGGLESQWRPVFCSAFGDQSLRQIACGGAHTLFLTALYFSYDFCKTSLEFTQNVSIRDHIGEVIGRKLNKEEEQCNIN
ncbi:unnamed protein product [Ilex paraguariensis]|uniref:Uncharacterized protein n=1 Tax=Ilex paraguariensis TaxID=185542 RepID=A0ABC8TB70_9AQUA